MIYALLGHMICLRHDIRPCVPYDIRPFRADEGTLRSFKTLSGEDGSIYTDIGVMTSGGFIFNEDGEVIDPNEPSVSDILMVMAGPPLDHKGSWLGWVMGLIICILTAVDILFADELFRLHMAFHISRAEDAEPSDWEIAGRYIGWTVMPVIALVLFIIGLQ